MRSKSTQPTSRRRAQVVRVLERQARTGRSFADLAEEAGVPYSTALYWRKKLEGTPERPADESSPRFVAVEIRDEERERSPLAQAGSDAFQVVLENGCQVRVPREFDPSALARLLDVLSARC